eukprot:scpid73108/ scgid15716/ 
MIDSCNVFWHFQMAAGLRQILSHELATTTIQSSGLQTEQHGYTTAISTERQRTGPNNSDRCARTHRRTDRNGREDTDRNTSLASYAHGSLTLCTVSNFHGVDKTSAGTLGFLHQHLNMRESRELDTSTSVCLQPTAT